MKLARFLAFGGALSWNIVLVRLLAAAAAPEPCEIDCDHAGLGSSSTGIDLAGTYGAYGGTSRADAALRHEADTRFDPAPYAMPPQPAGGLCRDRCRTDILSGTQAPCPDEWVGRAPRLVIAPVPAGVPLGTSDDPRPIVACVLVTWSGRAAEAYLVRNEATKAWDNRLPLAIRNSWLFEPARRQGQAVAAWARVRVNPDIAVPPPFDTYPRFDKLEPQPDA